MASILSSAFLAVLALSSSTLARPAPASGDLVLDAGNSTLDKTPGSGGHWTAIVDNDDPRTLDQIMTDLGVHTDEITHVYNNSAFKGFAGTLSSHCVNEMSVQSGLKTFERTVDIFVAGSQSNAPWGLQRLSQDGPISNPPTSDADVAAFDFTYNFNGSVSDLGKGVDIYMVDTGINTNHVDFDGRATFGFTIDDKTDTEGHGTHTAGTAGSTTFGVAKNANLISVKVLGSESGSSADIISGIDFVIQNHNDRKSQSGFVGSVASMSLGSPSRSTSIDEAVQQASTAGIHFSVAAGNENQDACNSSPAAVSKDSDVISVGATTIDDTRATFSNFGECTTVYAPGLDITSTWIGGTNTINTISGTSMACPHVSGLIATLLASNPSLSTDTAGMKALILSMSQKISTDQGDVQFINNGASAASNKLKVREFVRHVRV